MTNDWAMQAARRLVAPLSEERPNADRPHYEAELQEHATIIREEHARAQRPPVETQPGSPNFDGAAAYEHYLDTEARAQPQGEAGELARQLDELIDASLIPGPLKVQGDADVALGEWLWDNKVGILRWLQSLTAQAAVIERLRAETVMQAAETGTARNDHAAAVRRAEAAESALARATEALRHAADVAMSMSCEDLPADHEQRAWALDNYAEMWPLTYGPIRAALTDTKGDDDGK